ncbi:MAG: zinc ribbon domain-containing protein [Anaerolineae bacterium]
MEQRTYRGDIDPEGLADALIAHFDHGDLMAQKVTGQDGHLMVQIATRERGWGAARSALSIGIAPVQDGVRVTVGEQRWLDAAASLAITGLGALINPRSLLWRIDDIARDVGKLTLDDQVWDAVEHYCDSVGARLGLAEKHLVVACPYCGVGNPVGEGKCSACGGGLAEVQPVDCHKCGFVLPQGSRFCSRCGTALVDG